MRIIFFIIAVFLSVTQLWANNKTTSVILLGDMPYDAKQESILKTKIIPKIKATKNNFTVHLGDFLAGSSFHSCSDKNIIDARDYIYRLNPNKSFYTPGDNDWTDCDRKSKEQRFSEYERLSFLRKIFYAPAPTYPDEFAVIHQENYPENMIWQVNDIIYLTLHIVGTNNGRDKILLNDDKAALQKINARDDANIQWLKRAHQLALDNNADAMIIFAQADITNVKKRFLGLMDEAKCTHNQLSDCNGFAIYSHAMIDIAQKFNKPILYIHGDTGDYCIDKKFGGDDAQNLWRMNNAGDFQVIDAVKMVIKHDNRKFSHNDISFYGLLSHQPLTKNCA